MAHPRLSRVKSALVDDDMLLRRSLQLLLRSCNYEVRAYATAEALLADPGSRTSACLVTDLTNPEMDGISLLRRLRAGRWLGPPILITSSTAIDLVSRAADEGFHAVLMKPLVDRIIRETVRNALAHAERFSPKETVE